MLAKET